ncbi:MAG: metallophosphoesterase family protein, partial [Gammaproteobacteria bacterium]
MRVQYFSDVHLEFGECEFPLTDADVVVAAGDINVDIEAIDWLAQAKCPVIYIAGNHEYYGGDLIHTRKRIVAAANAAKIDYLECSEVHIDDVRFLGATLWTDYADADDDVMEEAEQGMN